MFALTWETLAVLPRAWYLNPRGTFDRWTLMPGVEVAEFELNFGLELGVGRNESNHAQRGENKDMCFHWGKSTRS